MGKHSRQRDISAKDLGWEEAGGSLEAERGPRWLSEGEGYNSQSCNSAAETVPAHECCEQL